MMKIPELLAPVGSRGALYAAVANGCDAVYLGGKNFGARNFAENFDSDTLDEIMDYCHLRGVNVYMTVNTLYRNDELQGVIEFCEKAYKAGADAFIMQDVGTAFFVRKNFPGIKLFASTQASVGDAAGAEFLSEYFDRVILAREASFETIREITALGKIEVEVFAHGALCVCQSGQCLMSGIIGGRSGNRGKCAQPCRMKYDLIYRGDVVNSGYLLSPRDLCTLTILPELVACGVDSIKIEGRMKSPEYAALTTRIYREHLDKIGNGDTSVDEESLRKLTQIFNRGGSFTDGYFNKWGGPDMMSTETPKSRGIYVGDVVSYRPAAKRAVIAASRDLVCGDGIEVWTRTGPHTGTYINKDSAAQSLATVDIDGRLLKGDKVYLSFDKRLSDELKKSCSADAGARKITAKARVYAKLGKPVRLTLEYGGISVQSEGAVCARADKHPMTPDAIKRQLSKTGATALEFCFVEADIDENLFIGIKDLNELRRNASELLKKGIIQGGKREALDIKLDLRKYKPRNEPVSRPRLSAHVCNLAQLEAVIAETPDCIIFESYLSGEEAVDEALKAAGAAGIKLYAALPKTICGSESEYRGLVKGLPEVEGYLLRYFGQIAFCKGKGDLIADHGFNVFNSLQLEFLLNAGFDKVTISPELNLNQIKSTAGSDTEVITHGRLPLMVTNQCVIGNMAENRNGKGRLCKRRGTDGYTLRDGLGLEFPVVTDCVNCVAQIFNSKPIFTLNKLDDISGIKAGGFRLIFTTEKGEDAAALTAAYKAKLLEAYPQYEPGRPDNSQAVRRADRLVRDILENSAIYDGVTNGHFYRGVL